MVTAEFKTDVLRPGDTLVVTSTRAMSREEAVKVRDQLAATGVPFLLIDGTAFEASMDSEAES